MCEQNMMCLILADMRYLCCISRVLLAFNWYPGSCQRPVKGTLTPAYPITTAYGKRKRNRTNKKLPLLHYPTSYLLEADKQLPCKGRRQRKWTTSTCLHLHVCMREHLCGAQCGLISVFSLSQSTCIYFPRVMELFVKQNNHKTQFLPFKSCQVIRKQNI